MDEVAKIYARFCREMLAALDAKDKPEWFSPEHGLCLNLSEWLGFAINSKKPEYAEVSLDMDRKVKDYQARLMSLVAHPFNKTTKEYRNEDKYKNPLRLAHLREHAKDL